MVTQSTIRFRHPNARFAFLGAGVGVAFLAASAPAQTSIHVPGIVRDFQQTHPDFDVIPSGGYGHYAGEVSLTLPADGRPDFSGGGYLVNGQWRNKTANEIAPHMYMGDGGSILVTDPLTPPALGTLDSWDSTSGPYGGGNVGPAPPVVVGAPMPVITVPSPMPISVGDVSLNNDTISADLHCDNLRLRNTTTIDGNIYVYCDGDFDMMTMAEIVLTPGSTLEVYFNTSSSTWNHVEINLASGDPSLVKFYNLGINPFVLHNHATVYAQFYSPNATMDITNHGSLFGTYHGKGVTFSNHGDFHVDTIVNLDACGAGFSDTLGAAGAASAGGITSAATYDQWYADVLGTNLSQLHTIEMVRNGSGVYEFSTPAFHPIDDRLYGNEGQAHNYFFTYQITADFIYNSCIGQYFEFSGADDAWMFIDSQLVIDLGGVIPGTPQVVELDRLGLTDGQAYQMRFFYAQRQAALTDFSLNTNAVLQPPAVLASGTAGFD